MNPVIKKSVSLMSILSILVFSLLLSPVHAQNPGKTEQDLIAEKLERGLSREDAVYYTKLDKMIENYEKNGIELDFVDAPDTIDDEFARKNNDEFRKKVLDGDPAALKKGMKSMINIQENGFNDMMKLQEEDRKNGELKNSYTVIYPDGSSFTATSFKSEKVNTENNEVYTNSTHILGPWNESHLGDFLDGLNDEIGIEYTGGYEWKYKTGVNEAQIKVLLDWYYTALGIETTYVDGAEYYSGVLQKTDTNTVRRGKVDWSNPLSDKYVQAYHDVEVEVSSSFSAGYGLMSINLNAGAQWHQYAIVEVNGWNDLYCYYGQYAN